jgi:hypothetical protein
MKTRPLLAAFPFYAIDAISTVRAPEQSRNVKQDYTGQDYQEYPHHFLPFQVRNLNSNDDEMTILVYISRQIFSNDFALPAFHATSLSS